MLLPSWMIGLPNASRVRPRVDHQVQRLLGLADRAHAVVDAAGAEAQLADLEAAAFAQQHVLRRHAHIVEAAGACGRAARRHRRTRVIGPTMFTPGASDGHQDLRLAQVAAAPSGLVWTMVIMTLQRGSPAPEM